jgi:hypothetical protein
MNTKPSENVLGPPWSTERFGVGIDPTIPIKVVPGELGRANRMWTNGVDTVIGPTLEAALTPLAVNVYHYADSAALLADFGETPEDWQELPREKMVVVYVEDDSGNRHRIEKTVAEWCEVGPVGLLCSTEF